MSKRGSGSSAKADGTATNARSIENMNEAQLDKEIARTKKKIGSYDKAMSESQKRTQFERMDRVVDKAVSYTSAYDKNNPPKTDFLSFKKPKSKFPALGKLKASFQNQQKQQPPKAMTP